MDLHGLGGPGGEGTGPGGWDLVPAAWLSGLPWFLGSVVWWLLRILLLPPLLLLPAPRLLWPVCRGTQAWAAHRRPFHSVPTISTVANNELGYNSWPKHWLKNSLG